MSILNPIRQQYNRLMEAFQGRNFLSLDEAAQILRVSKPTISKSLFLMEKKGLFTDDAPVVDISASLLLRNHHVAAHAATSGILHSILETIGGLTSAVEKYENHQAEALRSGKARNIGRAIMNFAENTIDGKKFRTSFHEAAHGYLANQRKAESSREDIGKLLSDLQKNASDLRNYVEMHPDNLYPEELRNMLLNLRADVENWRSIVHHADTEDRWEKAFQQTVKLKNDLGQFEKCRQLAEQKPVTVLPQDEVRGEIKVTISFLESIKDEVTEYRTHASLLQIIAILKQLDEAYAQASDGFSTSDARSLKNIYLPTLRSLVEKYLKYESKSDEAALVAYKPDDTLNVLENDLPKALKKIRDELLIRRTSAMEDEAIALRQKLELDGLL